MSGVLKHYTHNSIHLITPFDSGGSSAEIRRAFDMLSVGDFRNRLVALSDDSSLGNPQVVDLFSHRLSKFEPLLAQAEFREILLGHHPLCKAVSLPMRSILISHLRWFAQRMPADFDLQGASIGNLIITGCSLEHDGDFVTAIYLIWSLLGVKGLVRPLTGANLHVRARYEDGTEELGQHLLGKQKGRHGKILEIDFVEALTSLQRQEPCQCYIDIVSSELVGSADVICFPMGSFFGSLLVNLLPMGVGEAIAKRHCPKLYIPNTGIDPEMSGHTLKDCIQRIIDMIQADVRDKNLPVNKILNFILVDTTHCHYCVDIDSDDIESTFEGVKVLNLCLVSDETKEAMQVLVEKSHKLDPTKVAEVLLTLGS